jgi:hypothetical protein
MPFQHQHTPRSHEVRKKKFGPPHTDDNASDVENLAKKMCVVLIDSAACTNASVTMHCRLSLKVFSNPSGDMWKANVKDIQGEILCVSQFTLMANTSKGNKPDFHRAMVRIYSGSLSVANGGGGLPFSLAHETESRQINHRPCTPRFYSSWALNTLPRRSRVNGPVTDRSRRGPN